MMKKFLVLVAAVMMVAVNTSAQNENLHHEISLSYGVGSASQFGGGIGEGFAKAIFSDTENDDGFILGPISAEYFYHFNNPRLAFGGFVSYSKWDSNIMKRSGDKNKVGEHKRNYFAVMPAFKWYWSLKNTFGLYSKVAAGAAFLNSTEKDFATNKTTDNNGTYFMFQLSFIGVEFGKKFRGFAEAGVGEQGFLLAGIRYKF